MKKVLALICALILVCSIVATVLAECSYTHTLTNTILLGYHNEPHWTGCAFNSYIHAHTVHYKDMLYIYTCPKCGIISKTVKIGIAEVCPCQP